MNKSFQQSAGNACLKNMDNDAVSGRCEEERSYIFDGMESLLGQRLKGEYIEKRG